uniref:UDP-N-acetylglucosamine transferase subunit ALG13 n=1 Tax=Equus asinus TaxID=9793 RepID=A0A8C4M6V0_EQUAS
GSETQLLVGTTSFDDLTACISVHNTLQVSMGGGWAGTKMVPEPLSTESLTLDLYRYKDSLKDLQKEDLVVSHTDAGSHLETLEKRKPLVVVINEKLMNNHQLKLAKQLHKMGISSTEPAALCRGSYCQWTYQH